jgi:serine/threonine-protein kinase HipA
MNNPSETVRVLEIEVSDVRAGFLAGYNDGKNIFTFAHEYINLEKEIRPTLSLKFYDQPMNVFRKPLISRVKLPPLFSNLLPEGELRDYYVRNLKIDSDHDFAMLSFLGRDLPGAIKARELTKNDIPPYAMTYRRCIPPKLLTARNNRDNNFSLCRPYRG